MSTVTDFTNTTIAFPESTLATFKVQKSGVFEWHTVEAITAQDAVEQYFGVSVVPFEIKGNVTVFDDLRDSVNQLYAALGIPGTQE